MAFLSFIISFEIHYTNTFPFFNYKTIAIVTHGNINIGSDLFRLSRLRLNINTYLLNCFTLS